MYYENIFVINYKKPTTINQTYKYVWHRGSNGYGTIMLVPCTSCSNGFTIVCLPQRMCKYAKWFLSGWFISFTE
jgi:hypothetical protein